MIERDENLKRQFEECSTTLQSSEARFRNIIARSVDGIVIVDDVGTIRFVNPTAESLLGRKADELIGELFGFPMVACETSELTIVSSKDSRAIIEMRVVETEWEGEHALLANLRDITVQKETLEALRFSEERYKLLYRDIPTMIATIDANFTMLSVNPYNASQLGYTMEEMEGRSVLTVFHDDDRPAVAEQLQKCLVNPTQVYRWQFRKIRKDGGLLWVEEMARAVYGRDGMLNILIVCQDISEQKRAKEQREHLLLQLDAVLNSITEGVTVCDLDGNVLTLNPAALAIHGYDSVEQVQRKLHQFKDTFELSDFDGQPISFEQWPLARVLRDERFIDYEAILRRKDTGTSLLVSYSGTPVRTSSDEKILAVVTMRDITERRHAVEAVQKSEQKFSKIFHAAPGLIGISTLEEGRLIDVNETALQTLGYQREEVIGRTGQELGLWEESERVKAVQALAELGSVQNYEIRFRGKTGQIFNGLFSAELIDINGDRCMLSLVRNITDRKRAEEALVQAKEEWERTFDSVLDLIAILDNQFRITRVNRAMAERLKRQPEECRGLICYEVIHGTKSPPEFCPQTKTLTDGREHEAEVYDPYLGGYFLVSTTPLLAPDGKMTGAVYMAKDITGRKQMEEDIRVLNAELIARAVELEAANQELEAFNYSVAHDLRKPLTVINGYCQLLTEACGHMLDEDCKGYLREAYDGTGRMNRLIDDLLNFSQAGHAEPKRQQVDLSSLAYQVASELQQAEPERLVTFRILNGISADTDPALLRIVLSNLFGNAWKYTCIREEGIIEFDMAEIDGQGAYFVRDNGIGFDPSGAEKLFEPFQRLESARVAGGLGIGLATVARVIQRLGGQVRAEGEPGKGATFYFTLP